MTTSVLAPTHERRAAPRVPFHGSVTLEMLNSPLRVKPRGAESRLVPSAALGARRASREQSRGTSRGIETQAVNLSERGLCLRVQEALDINSRLRMQLRDQQRKRPLACQGRVSWVVQRLDLREAAPFIYDVGIEFIDPPNLLKRLASRLGLALIVPAAPNGTSRTLRPAAIHNRLHVPHLTHEPSAPKRWHLVISVDGAPCFSQHFPSIQNALDAWRRFKRDPAPSRPRSK